MPTVGFSNYYRLPDDLKAEYTRDEWAWLSDQEKQRLLAEQGWPEDDSEDPAE